MPNNSSTTKKFIDKATDLHSGRYCYTNTSYTRRRDSLIITCHKHGDFTQVAGVHLKGGNCPTCARLQINTRNTLTKEEFVERAISAHGGTYTYEDCGYVSMRGLVKVSCSAHGEFYQKASVHTSGHGCPSCASYGFDTKAPATLYYVCVDESLYKIGITNNSVIKRFVNDNNSIRVIKTWDFSTGGEARKEESALHSMYSEYKYRGKNILKTGNTELFTIDVMGEDI